MRRLILLLCILGTLHCARSNARVQGHTRVQTLPRASVEQGQYTLHWYAMDTHGNAVLDYILGFEQVEFIGIEQAENVLKLLHSPTYESSHSLAEMRAAFYTISRGISARSGANATGLLTTVMQTAEDMRKRLPKDHHQLFLGGYIGWIIYQSALSGPVPDPETSSGRLIQGLRTTFSRSAAEASGDKPLDLKALRLQGASIVIDIWSKLLDQAPDYTGPAPFHSSRIRREIQDARNTVPPKS